LKVGEEATLVHKLDRQDGAIFALDWSADGSKVAIAGAGPTVTIHDAETGARIAASGNAGTSIPTDTLVLTASNIPGPGLFFQGTGQFGGGLGLAFGDGLLCAGGTITRLGVVFPTGNSASYPGGLTPSPIHVAGSVSSGDVRHYQCWYRDAAAFCTSATFNLTQGLTLTFGP
jgi:hypothetical protein